MFICGKLFGVSQSNLAVRFSALADFLRSFVELAVVVYFSVKIVRYCVLSANSLFESIIRKTTAQL